MNRTKPLNKTLLKLVKEEPIKDMRLLDLGCGYGRLTFALAPVVKYIVGIDRSPEQIKKAKELAVEKGTDNIEFHVADARTTDYTKFGKIDMIVAHFFMSNEAVYNSFRCLGHGNVFAFACFHEDRLKELGVKSRFSYSLDEMEDLLKKAGFKVEYLKAEKEILNFKSKKEFYDYFKGSKAKWERTSRWKNFMEYLDRGGREMTYSTLVGKARKIEDLIGRS